MNWTAFTFKNNLLWYVICCDMVFNYVVCFITDYFEIIFKNICHPSLFILGHTGSLKFSDLKKIPITIMVMSSWTDKILQVPAMPCRVLCCQLSPELGQASAQLQWGAGAVARPGRHQARAAWTPWTPHQPEMIECWLGESAHPGSHQPPAGKSHSSQHTSGQWLQISIARNCINHQGMIGVIFKGWKGFRKYMFSCYAKIVVVAILWKKENFPNK